MCDSNKKKQKTLRVAVLKFGPLKLQPKCAMVSTFWPPSGPFASRLSNLRTARQYNIVTYQNHNILQYLLYTILIDISVNKPVVAREGSVHLVIGRQQLFNQLLLAEPGDYFPDPRLHFFTHCV